MVHGVAESLRITEVGLLPLGPVDTLTLAASGAGMGEAGKWLVALNTEVFGFHMSARPSRIANALQMQSFT